MRKFITIVTALIFFTQPLYGLAPSARDKDPLIALGVVLELAKFGEETNPQKRSEIKRNVEGLLSRVSDKQKIVPYWETYSYNKNDGSFEIVMNYIDNEKKSNLVIKRFVRKEDKTYEVIEDRNVSLANNKIVRSILGINIPGIKGMQTALDKLKQVGLPNALENRRTLMGNVPENGGLAYLYAVTNEEPILRVLGAIEDVKKRMGAPIKAVVVLGANGQSLNSRVVVGMLDSQGIKFIFPDNIANSSIWLSLLEGINPKNVLLYVNSKTGTADETMVNFRFFWERLIRQIGPQGVANSLIEKLKAAGNLNEVNLLNDLDLSENEKGLLQTTLNHIIISTIPENNGPIYKFAEKNNIPVIPQNATVSESYSVLFPETQFTTALAGHDIEKMRQALGPIAGAFKEDTPELNPALESAIYAYIQERPILSMVSSNNKLMPLFEWARQLVNGSLGKEGKGLYLTFASGEEMSQELMSAPSNKLFLVINTGEEKLKIPEGAKAIVINLQEINQETLAGIFLFLQEFTVRYATLQGVNPFIKQQLEISNPKEETKTIKELLVTGGFVIPNGLKEMLKILTREDNELAIPVSVPVSEFSFQNFLPIGNYRQQNEIENMAQDLAIQLYMAGKLGKLVNPFYIYSANPNVKLIGKFIKYLGGKLTARLAKQGGGVLWDYLIETKDQYGTASYLVNGRDIAVTTFVQFLGEVETLRQTLNNEGRLTNTVSVPNEEEENLLKLYHLLVRTEELYARLVENENKEGETLEGLVEKNESVVIETKTGVMAGELPRYPKDAGELIVQMSVAGVEVKRFINPDLKGIQADTINNLKSFKARISRLANIISKMSGIKDSFLGKLVTREGLKERTRPQFYAFRLEDTIAKIEVGSEVSDTLWEEIRIKTANTMIAKTVQEIKRINPQAKVIAYTEDLQLTERKIHAALDAIDTGGVFDIIVCGNIGAVLASISNRGWAKSVDEAIRKTIFASANNIERESIRSVIVPREKFIPFPELMTVMQAMLNIENTGGQLPVESIIASYIVWLELAGFTKDEIGLYVEELRRILLSGTNFVVSLPIPPTPKTGSVIQLLDRDYEESSKTKGFA